MENIGVGTDNQTDKMCQHSSLCICLHSASLIDIAVDWIADRGQSKKKKRRKTETDEKRNDVESKGLTERE